MLIETEAGLQKLPEESLAEIEVSILHRVVDLVGAMKRLHAALTPRGILRVTGPFGAACWDDPRAKRQINYDTFNCFHRNGTDGMPHFFTIQKSSGEVALTKSF